MKVISALQFEYTEEILFSYTHARILAMYRISFPPNASTFPNSSVLAECARVIGYP